MWLELKSKNKIQFIDGSLPKSTQDDASFATWDKYNTFVLSWINLSLNSEIRKSVIWTIASNLWQDL
ncbi:hypothetical protein AHAS_Ahas19G0215500 [Arachis hypogaea]